MGGRGDTYQSSLRWQNFSVFVCLSNNRSMTSGFCLQRERGKQGGEAEGERERGREGDKEGRQRERGREGGENRREGGYSRRRR